MNYGMVPPPPELNSSTISSNKRSRFSASYEKDNEKHQQVKLKFLYFNYLKKFF